MTLDDVQSVIDNNKNTKIYSSNKTQQAELESDMPLYTDWKSSTSHTTVMSQMYKKFNI